MIVEIEDSRKLDFRYRKRRWYFKFEFWFKWIL